jgi:hypothetical protein
MMRLALHLRLKSVGNTLASNQTKAQLQPSCPEVASMLTSDNLHITSQASSGRSSLDEGCFKTVFRPLAPAHMCEVVFQVLHSIHYPGVRATRHLIRARFCWPQMAKSITLMARTCLFCQQGKVHTHIQLQLAAIPVPYRFTPIHVDLVGLLPPWRGNTYLFTVIDSTESPFPSFLEELQTAMASRSPPPTRHNSSLAPTTLLAVLLLACFLLVLLRREAAAAGTPLRRTLRFPGAVNTLFPPADRGPNRQGLHAPPQACPDTRRHRAGTATMQGETRCTGVT